MKTSDRLPEECREEIRERISERQLVLKVMAGQGFYTEAQKVYDKLQELAWVLGEDEA